MAFLYFFSGLFLGALLAFLWTRSQVATTAQKMSADLAVAKSQLEAAQKNAADSVNAEREHSQKLLSEMQKQMETSKKLMQEEMRTMAAQMLSESREHLNAADKERLDALLKPLHERIEAFNQNVTAATKEGASNKTEIKTTFEETIKLLQGVQTSTVKSIREDNERAIRELRQQTERIGNDAASLTQALKGDSKMQGDWGEMILETTLESCGLTKNCLLYTSPSPRD